MHYKFANDSITEANSRYFGISRIAISCRGFCSCILQRKDAERRRLAEWKGKSAGVMDGCVEERKHQLSPSDHHMKWVNWTSLKNVNKVSCITTHSTVYRSASANEAVVCGAIHRCRYIALQDYITRTVCFRI